MPLSLVIAPGDNLDADDVDTLFSEIETLVNEVAPAQLERGSVHERHISGTAFKRFSTQLRTGSMTGTGQVVPTGVTNHATTSGEAVYCWATVDIEGIGAGPAITLELQVDAVQVVPSVGVWTMQNGERREVVLGWAFEASASTHLVEVHATVNTNVRINDAQITVMAVNR